MKKFVIDLLSTFVTVFIGSFIGGLLGGIFIYFACYYGYLPV